jgi:hypothetical protein
MNEDLADAFEALTQTIEGAMAAQKAVQEALIATILKQFPPLADPFLEMLGLTEDHQRLQMEHDTHVAHSALTKNLAQIRSLVEHLKAQ